MNTAISFLNKLPENYHGGDVIPYITEENERIRATVQALGEQVTNDKIRLEEIWSQNADMVYELSSVFVHRGSSPSWGHYFFYTRHLPEKPDSWFKMNDNQVTAVLKEEVLADTTDSTANAYLVGFRNDENTGMTKFSIVDICEKRIGGNPNSK